MRSRILLFVLPTLLFACKTEPDAGAAPAKKAAAVQPADAVPAKAIALEEARPTPTNEAGQIEIRADAKGFTPARIWVEEGKPVKLLFTRVVEKTCMDGVVFPSLGIEEDLEVGEPVEVAFTPEAAGELVFHCPMGHGKSAVVVLPKKS